MSRVVRKWKLCISLVSLVLLLLSWSVQSACGSTNVAASNDILIAHDATMTLDRQYAKAARRWRRNDNNRQSDRTSTESSIPEGMQPIGTSMVAFPSEFPSIWTRFVAECEMPTDLGTYRMRSYVYSSPMQSLEPIAMVYGDIRGKENVLVRVHDQCFTSEVFGSLRCDCREQLKESLRLVKEQGGVVIYLQQEGRGIGIANKVAAYALQDQGLDTVDANTHLGFKDELREYHAIPEILKDLDIRSIRLMTNNPYKMTQLEGLGVNIVERVPIEVAPNRFNQRYLRSKRDKMRHILSEEILSSTGSSEASQDEVENKDANQQLPVDGYALGRDTVIAAINAIHKGELVIVVDDADRENEGDLIMAAEKASPETIGFMVRYTSGVICVSLEANRLEELALPPMVVTNEDPKGTAYSISVDYKYNTTTGISAADRALTFRKLVDPSAKKEEFQRPGHVFPLRYKEGGVLSRRGHTEASLDLTQLAGLRSGGVLAEIVHDDGSMMRLPALQEMSRQHGLVLTSVQDIKAYREELQQQQQHQQSLQQK